MSYESVRLVRTDFTNDDAWGDVLERLDASSLRIGDIEPATGIQIESDPRRRGWATRRLLAEGDSSLAGVIVLADATTMQTPEHSLLVVAVQGGLGDWFRCLPEDLLDVLGALEVDELEFNDFARQTDASKILRLATPSLAARTTPPEQIVGDLAVRSFEAIAADLDGTPSARALSGDLGETQVSHILVGPRARCYQLLSRLDSWWGATLASGQIGKGEPLYLMWMPEAKEQRITGSFGHIRLHPISSLPPAQLELAWQWFVPTPALQPGPPQLARPFLDSASKISIALATLDARPGEPHRTRVELTHSGLPVEWLGDMREFWLAHLRTCQRVLELNP